MVIVTCAIAALLAPPAQAAELRQETAAAFDRYVEETEAQMGGDLHEGRFLFMDRWPDRRREAMKAQLWRGEIYIEHLHTVDDGQTIRIPRGLVHDWVGIAFIPGATLSETIDVLGDYDHHKNIYKPNVRESKLLERKGNISKTYMQFYSKSMVTVVLNANFDVDLRWITPTRVETRSHSTRIAELENLGKRSERELPVGKDHGYLWRLYSYWRMEEADGGVYIQVESIALSRGVPRVLAWLINPLIRSISRSYMSDLLTATSKAVIDRNKLATGVVLPAPPHCSPSARYATTLAYLSPGRLPDRP